MYVWGMEKDIEKYGPDMAMLRSKMQDYSGGEPLALFERVGEAMGMRPSEVIRVMILIKIERMNSLVRNGSVNFEGLDDTVKDLQGYSVLYRMALNNQINS